MAELDKQNDRTDADFLNGGSTMGALMRELDWTASSLGRPSCWSAALKTLVQVLLASKQPMFIAWGRERTWLYNDAFIAIAGRKHPGALGRPSADVWSEAWSELQPLFDRVFVGESIHMTGFALSLDRKGKIEEAHFDFSYTPILADGRTVDGLFGVCVETTAQVAGNRAELATANRERERLFEMSRDLFAVADFDGHLRSINPSWSRQLRRSDEELLSRPFSEIIHPDDLATTAEVVSALQSGKPVHQFHVRLIKANGEPIAFAWSAVPDTEPGSKIFYTVGRDITEETAAATELHAAQEALRQAQKMEAVGQLTGGIAHDFNNLLAAISGSLELIDLCLGQGRTDGMERYIRVAQSSAERAAALTHRLLAFSRRQTLDPKPTDVNCLVQGMHDLISRSVGPAVHVEFVGAGDLWLSKVDPSQLESALLNLAINARDAMPEGGRIAIKTANETLDERSAKERNMRAGQYISLCVADTGTGMSADVLARAFDPFYTTKPLGQGTGLGLSMVHGFAIQSGGQVRIWSNLGAGTTVCIYLPRFAGELEITAHPGGEEPTGRTSHGETILVIDDEEAVRMLISDVLGEAGYRVISAADGPSGLEILGPDTAVDLLITDVGLPGGMNGRQVADAARVRRKDLKVLFITGYAENAAIGDGHLASGMQVLTKPFGMDALRNRVRDMIAA
jgi:PAS domain S-box-containing protein